MGLTKINGQLVKKNTMSLEAVKSAKDEHINQAKNDIASGQSVAKRLENIEKILGLRE